VTRGGRCRNGRRATKAETGIAVEVAELVVRRQLDSRRGRRRPAESSSRDAAKRRRPDAGNAADAMVMLRRLRLRAKYRLGVGHRLRQLMTPGGPPFRIGKAPNPATCGSWVGPLGTSQLQEHKIGIASIRMTGSIRTAPPCRTAAVVVLQRRPTTTFSGRNEFLHSPRRSAGGRLFDRKARWQAVMVVAGSVRVH
jgi:hypothetical protein